MIWTLTIVTLICILRMILGTFQETWTASLIFGAVAQTTMLVMILTEARANAKFRRMFQRSISKAIVKQYGIKTDDDVKSDAEAKGH